MLKPLRGPALNESVRNYVKQYILENNLQAGDALPPEMQLAQDLGVGRSSVREAVKALQSLGIVEVRHGNGLFVRAPNLDPISETLRYNLEFDPDIFVEIFQIRVWLEAAAIEDAVKMISDDDIARLETVLQKWEIRLQNDKNHAELDEQFHRILYTALNNRTLISVLEVFWQASQKLDRAVQNKKDLWDSFEEHRTILESVKARDALRTRRQLTAHFRYAQTWFDNVVQSNEIVSL